MWLCDDQYQNNGYLKRVDCLDEKKPVGVAIPANHLMKVTLDA